MHSLIYMQTLHLYLHFLFVFLNDFRTIPVYIHTQLHDSIDFPDDNSNESHSDWSKIVRVLRSDRLLRITSAANIEFQAVVTVPSNLSDDIRASRADWAQVLGERMAQVVDERYGRVLRVPQRIELVVSELAHFEKSAASVS